MQLKKTQAQNIICACTSFISAQGAFATIRSYVLGGGNLAHYKII